MKFNIWKNLLVLLFIVFFACHKKAPSTESIIQPYEKNPAYWKYKGKPVLLLGATSDDNLFQKERLKSHLDSLHRAGGNYLRNTMSDRDPGNERAFKKNEDGKYDLNQWNEKYWQKFEDLLKLAEDRDIIVQIEIWDRFDHAREEWKSDPFNPKNNINYSYQEAGLDSLYPDHPGSNKQPFFYTVPTLQNNEVLLKYQKAFVNKLLSISLNFGNVLYCMDNETSGVAEWGKFWAEYIKSQAGEQKVFVTEMWDNWNVKSEMHKRTIDHPELYDFIDLSQNSHTTGHENWVNAQYIFEYIKNSPRPVNSTKIYGNDIGKWAGEGKNSDHAVITFFKNVLGGFASSRFHRPPSGLGLSERSLNSIKTVREIEELVKFWDIEPKMELLSDNEDGEAYISANEGKSYIIYFPNGGEVQLDLTQQVGTYTLKWIDVNKAKWLDQEEISGGQKVTIIPLDVNGSIAVIQKKKTVA